MNPALQYFLFLACWVLPCALFGQGINSISIISCLFLLGLCLLPYLWWLECTSVDETLVPGPRSLPLFERLCRYCFTWLVISFGTFGSFYTVFGDTTIGYFMVLGCAFLHALFIVFFTILPMVEFNRKFPSRFLHFLFFPIFFTGSITFYVTMVPGGGLFPIAYSIAYDLGILKAFAGLFGIEGIHFFVGLVCSIVCEILYANTNHRRSAGIVSKSTKDRPASLSFAAIKYISFLTIVFVFVFAGSQRIIFPHNQFFQKRLKDINPQGHLVFSCFIGSVGTNDASTNGEQGYVKDSVVLQQNEKLVQETEATILKQGNVDIALWSEGYANVFTDVQENELLRLSSKTASKTKIVLGITYTRIYPNAIDDATLQYNITTKRAIKLALFHPNGTLSWIYQKSNIIPGIEESIVTPGINGQPIPINFGERFTTVSGLIGWDYLFPDFVRVAAAMSSNAPGKSVVDVNHGPDVMLAPSWDWGSIGIYIDKVASFRAVENGFTLLKCSAGGMSSVYDPSGEAVYKKLTISNKSGFTVQIPRVMRHPTPFAITGELLGWICFVFTLLAMVVALMPDQSVFDATSWYQSKVDMARALLPAFYRYRASSASSSSANI